MSDERISTDDNNPQTQDPNAEVRIEELDDQALEEADGAGNGICGFGCPSSVATVAD